MQQECGAFSILARMSPYTSIRNIIFDFGGVLINLNYSLTSNAFNQLGFDINRHFTQMQQSDLFNQLETGKIPPAVFYEELRKLGGQHLTDEQLAHAWNAMILDLPMERIDMLRRLKAKYSLYLLSNTNQIHASAFVPYLNKLLGENVWPTFFDKVYYSHQVGLRKPNREIYEYVLADAGIKAEESLFLDDAEKNLVAPSTLGIQTILVKEQPVTELLKGF